MKIKKGDNVIVTTGKDRGKTGTVLSAIPRENAVVVEGVNVATKHARARRRRSRGQVVEVAMPIDVSNVSLLENGKAVRAGYTRTAEGKKVRISRASGKEI